MAKVVLSEEELKLVEEQRAQKKIKDCSDEIAAVLAKYGFSLQVKVVPELVLVPAQEGSSEGPA